jgi:hypothetical protein
MKPRNLTDIPNPTFGAMVRALLRGEAKTLGEAYRQLEGAMKYTKAERLEMVLAGWKATPPHLDGNDWSRADQSYWFDRLDEVLHGDEGRGATSFGAAVLSARAAIDARRQRATKAAPDYDGECCALCKCNHGSPIRTLTEEHCICRDDGHRWVSRKVAAPPAGETSMRYTIEPRRCGDDGCYVHDGEGCSRGHMDRERCPRWRETAGETPRGDQ